MTAIPETKGTIATALEGDIQAQQDLVSNFCGQKQFVTVMIQSLPWTFQEDDLIREINRVTTPWSFDFFYMPWNTKRDSNCGYAFVNFKAPLFALECAKGLIGRTFGSKSKTIKSCVVVPAKVQGLMTNVEHFRDRVVCCPNNPHCPFIIMDGKKLSFQEAVELMCPSQGPKKNSPPARAQAINGAEGRRMSEILVDPCPEPALERRADGRVNALGSEGFYNGNHNGRSVGYNGTSRAHGVPLAGQVQAQGNPPQPQQQLRVQQQHLNYWPNNLDEQIGVPVTRMVAPPPGLHDVNVSLSRQNLNALRSEHFEDEYADYETSSQTSLSNSTCSFYSCHTSEPFAHSTHKRVPPGSDAGSSTESTATDGIYGSGSYRSSEGSSSEEDFAPLTALDLDVMERFISKFS